MTTQATDAAPLADWSAPADFAAAAERHRQDAEAIAARAAQDREKAAGLVAAAEAEAARIVGEARQSASDLTRAAMEADRKAGNVAALARVLAITAQNAAGAAEADVRAAALEDELDRLTGEDEALADRLAALAAERQDAQDRLAAATGDADLDAMTALRGRIASVDAAAPPLQARKDAVLARAVAIGDGAPPKPGEPAGELFATREAAARCRDEVHRILNRLYPDRPQARAARAFEDLGLAFEAQQQRIAEAAACTASKCRDLA